MIEQSTRDRRAERREATRAEILEAAWELARQQGLAGLSLRDIAAKIGMRPPSLY
jgi:AcrR family transcriptional regulator